MVKTVLLISQYTEISSDFNKICSYAELIEPEKRNEDKILSNHIRDL